MLCGSEHHNSLKAKPQSLANTLNVKPKRHLLSKVKPKQNDFSNTKDNMLMTHP